MSENESHLPLREASVPKERFSKIRKLVRQGRERVHAPKSRERGSRLEAIQTMLHHEKQKSDTQLQHHEGQVSAVLHLNRPVDHEKTEIKDPDLPIVWPHEEKKGKFREKSKRVKPGGVLIPFKEMLKKVISHTSRSVQVMERVNGKEAAPLAQKYSFIETVKGMGYTAPEQTLIGRKQSMEEKRGVVAQHFSDPEQMLICKPVNGAGGKGIIEARASDIGSVLPKLKKDYIIQEKVPINGEIRYMRQVNTADGVIRRVYDEKDIPKITGDGKKKKWQLIRESNLPLSAKLATGFRDLGSLGTVVPEGGKMHVSRLGVPHKEKLEWRPENRQRVANVDRFMQQFLADLQTKVGTQLPQLCFDIGVKDMSALDKEYNFDEIKKNLVPFECQMPFAVNGYMVRSSRSPIDFFRMDNDINSPIKFGKKKDLIESSGFPRSRE